MGVTVVARWLEEVGVGGRSLSYRGWVWDESALERDLTGVLMGLAGDGDSIAEAACGVLGEMGIIAMVYLTGVNRSE